MLEVENAHSVTDFQIALVAAANFGDGAGYFM
jgi:hypothetical protein